MPAAKIRNCPQFDATFDSLTAREHLTFYARLKGFADGPLLNALVESLLQTVSLTPYADVQAGHYSGGNKRKLSLV